ncbi:MAG TPA: response regulator [Candidatus Limnocylindrales bacterium]|nr:response regulator [Candidatus Limnocylindrales bacterium]
MQHYWSMTPRNRRPRVLVVDDEAPIREVMRDVLSDEGYDVTAAPDGEEALLKCQEGCPDVILLDLNMPRLDGAAFLKRYRQEHPCDAHIVVVSALASGARTAREIKADAFLAKPFMISELAETVRLHTAC